LFNRAEFADDDESVRVRYEGCEIFSFLYRVVWVFAHAFDSYRPGLYVRLELRNVPCEFVTHFDPTYPILIGGLLPNERTMGFLQVWPIFRCPQSVSHVVRVLGAFHEAPLGAKDPQDARPHHHLDRSGKHSKNLKINPVNS
jgi:hypothetical protein